MVGTLQSITVAPKAIKTLLLLILPGLVFVIDNFDRMDCPRTLPVLVDVAEMLYDQSKKEPTTGLGES